MLSWHASFMRWPRFEPWMQKDGRSLLCEQKAENAPLNNFSLGGICWSCFWQYCSCTWWKAFCHVEAMSVYWDLANVFVFLFFFQMQQTTIEHLVPLFSWIFLVQSARAKPEPFRHLERLSLSPRFLGRLAGNWPKSGCGPHMLQPQRH